MKEEEKDFQLWYQETSEKAGVLVDTATAARLLQTTQQYLHRLVSEGKIKKYYYENKPFIGMNDINKEIIKRQKKKEQLKKREEKNLEKIKHIVKETQTSKMAIFLKEILTTFRRAIKAQKEMQKKLREESTKMLKESNGKINKNMINEFFAIAENLKDEQAETLVKELEETAHAEIEKTIEKDLKNAENAN